MKSTEENKLFSSSKKIYILATIYISFGLFLNQYLHTWYYSKFSSQLFSPLFNLSVEESYLASLLLFLLVIFILQFFFKKIINLKPHKFGLYCILVFLFIELLSQIAGRSLVKLWMDFPIALVGFGFLFIPQLYGEEIQNKCNDLRILYEEVKDLIHISMSIFTAVIISSGFAFVAFIYGTKYPDSTANWALIKYFSIVLVYIAFGFLIGITGQLYTYLIVIRTKITER